MFITVVVRRTDNKHQFIGLYYNKTTLNDPWSMHDQPYRHYCGAGEPVKPWLVHYSISFVVLFFFFFFFLMTALWVVDVYHYNPTTMTRNFYSSVISRSFVGLHNALSFGGYRSVMLAHSSTWGSRLWQDLADSAGAIWIWIWNSGSLSMGISSSDHPSQQY